MEIKNTYLSVNKDLLMSIDSLAYFPSAPDWLILSEPAKSTKDNLEVSRLSGLERSTLSILISKIEWLLLLYKFNLWPAVILFLFPYENNSRTSLAFLQL